MSGERILIVEDDAKLAALTRDYLERQGYRVLIEGRGDAAEARILGERPDLVILDLMLPGLDGLSVCRAVRPHYDGPILMLTARTDEIDEVVGLEVGADDYLAKPVRPRLLSARIQSLLRRVARAEIRCGSLSLDPRSRLARLRGQELDLTTAEFDLLAYLARHAGQTVSREQLYSDVRGIEWDGLDRSVDLRIGRLRRKLGDDARQPRLIKSVRGTGYLLVESL